MWGLQGRVGGQAWGQGQAGMGKAAQSTETLLVLEWVFFCSQLFFIQLTSRMGKGKRNHLWQENPEERTPSELATALPFPSTCPGMTGWQQLLISALPQLLAALTPSLSHCCFTCSVQAHLLTQHYFLIPQDSQLSGKASKELPVLVPKTCGSERAFLPPCCCLQTPPLAINHTSVVPGSGTGFFL